MALIAAAVLPRLAAIAAGIRDAPHPTVVVAVDAAFGDMATAATAIRPIHRLVDASDSARHHGVQVGQRLLQAQAFFPAVRAVAVTTTTLREGLERIAEALLSLSPLVETVVPRPTLALPFFAVVVDLAGVPRSRPRLLGDLARIVAEHGHPCAVALSSSKTVSLAVARQLAATPQAFRGRLLDVDAADPAWLSRVVSIDALELETDVVESLRAAGVGCVADLEPLIDQGLVARLGAAAPHVLRVLRVLRGRAATNRTTTATMDESDESDSDGVSQPFVPTEVVGASRDLEVEVTTLEPLLFVLRPLVDEITRRLQRRRQRIAELTIALGKKKKAPVVVDVPLALPTVDVDVVLRVLRTRLERVFTHDDARTSADDQLLMHRDGVSKVLLVARRIVAATPRQLGLRPHDERGPPEALLHLVSELTARYGDGCVGVPVVTRERLPEAMTAVVWPPSRAAALHHEAQAQLPRRRRRRPVIVDRRTQHGRFAAGWPWPLRLLPTPTTTPFSDDDIDVDAPFAILEGEDRHGPYRRRYRRVTLKDGRQALTLHDDDAGVVLLAGWFD
jgi:hypothetical protein